jgi:uncharacterized protein (DUF2384 family)
MTASYAQRLAQYDQELEDVQRAFIKAVEHVRQSPETDDAFRERWNELAARMKGLRTGIESDDYDKDQLVTLATTLLDIRDELDRDVPGDLDVSDRLMILLERIRHVVRDALDEHVNGVKGDTGLVMADLERWLPNIPDQAVADLVGVNRRTLSRWKKLSGAPKRELRIFARLVAILRHSWDEEGVIAWFDRPRRDLGGRKPVSLLGDPNAEDTLVSAARSGRNQYAT